VLERGRTTAQWGSRAAPNVQRQVGQAAGEKNQWVEKIWGLTTGAGDWNWATHEITVTGPEGGGLAKPLVSPSDLKVVDHDVGL